jgi:formylmethanofuran dehydrogenase subunit E
MIPLGSLGVERCDDRRTLEEDLQQAKAFHGHLCHGMVLGVHMARYGCRVLGIDDPLTYRDLVVYIEMDRCASDAVAVVTGVTLGRRRLKWVDYGKMAATFVDLNTGEAVRIAPRPEVPHAGPDEDPLEVWKGWTEEQLFSCTPVKMEVPPQDRPGRPLHTVTCAECGEKIQDCREVEVEGKVLCLACAEGPYYEVL